MKRTLATFMISTALLFATTGCTSMSETQQGVLSGATIGALGVAGISTITGGSGTKGALVGGFIGAITGAVAGMVVEHDQ